MCKICKAGNYYFTSLSLEEREEFRAYKKQCKKSTNGKGPCGNDNGNSKELLILTIFVIIGCVFNALINGEYLRLIMSIILSIAYWPTIVYDIKLRNELKNKLNKNMIKLILDIHGRKKRERIKAFIKRQQLLIEDV